MGCMKHHAIIVHSNDEILIKEAHEKAIELKINPSELLFTCVNGFRSFFIPTDGSKEEWAESNIGDQKRNLFMSYCNSLKYEDGSNLITAIEIEYAGDDMKNSIINTSFGLNNDES